MKVSKWNQGIKENVEKIMINPTDIKLHLFVHNMHSVLQYARTGHIHVKRSRSIKQNATHVEDGVEDLAVNCESANTKIRHESRGINVPFFHRKMKAET